MQFSSGNPGFSPLDGDCVVSPFMIRSRAARDAGQALRRAQDRLVEGGAADSDTVSRGEKVPG